MSRFSIPLVAVLLGFGAFAARPSEVRPAARVVAEDRPASSPFRDEAVSESMLAERAAVSETPASTAAPKPASLPAQATLEPHVQNRPVMVALLQRELSLSNDQRRFVEDVFRRRELEVDDCHRQIRALNAVSNQGYHNRMQELRARSYREMGQVLDSRQHDRFLELVARGALNDVIGFTMEEGMVEVD